MEDEKNKFNLSADEVRNLKMEPPVDAWSKLESNLNKNQFAEKNKFKKSLQIAAAILILFLAAFITYNLIEPDKSILTQEITTQIKTTTSSESLENMDAKIEPDKNVNTDSESESKNTPTENKFIATNNSKNSLANKNEIESRKTDRIDNKNNRIHSKQKSNSNAEISTVGLHSNENTSDQDLYSEATINNVSEVNHETASSSTAVVNSSAATSSLENENANAINESSANTTLSDSAKNKMNIVVLQNSADTISTIKQRNFSLAVFYSPNHSKNHLNATTAFGNDEIKEYDQRETPQYSFSAGIRAGYQLNKNWSIAVEGLYSTLSYKINVPVVYAGKNKSNEMNYQYQTSCGTIQIPNQTEQTLNSGDSLMVNSSCSQTLKFINVPIEINYSLSKNKFRFYGFGGVAVNFVIHSSATMIIDNKETTMANNLEGLKKMNFGYLFGLGIEYCFLKQTGFFIEPNYKGSINSLTENLPFNCYPYSIGLNAGLNFHF